MKQRVMWVVGTVFLAIALAAFTGSALAGNGNGNTPPGQAKKASPSSSSTGSASQNSPSTPGTKPANNTGKNTACTTGGGTGSSATCSPANSSTASAPSSNGQKDVSKRYGNGTTAAQIANSRGAPSGTMIKGPGNSQPHKVCGKNGHFVDVHAVKSYSNNCATTLSASSSTKTTSTSTVSTSSTTTGQVAPTVVGGMAGAAALGGSSPAGVLGALAAGHGVRGGVLGAVAAKRTGKLPFTGFPVWLGLLVGFALTGAGLGLRRYARAAV
jgi:hypothetical protein